MSLTNATYADFVNQGCIIQKPDANVAGGQEFLDRLTLAAIGMNSEAGEAADVVKKYIFHGVPLDVMALFKEMGDVRWYYQLMLNEMGWTDEDIQEGNIAKLCERYPERYRVVPT